MQISRFGLLLALTAAVSFQGLALAEPAAATATDNPAVTTAPPTESIPPITTTATPAMEMDAGAAQVASHSTLQIKFVTALNSDSAHVGDEFLAACNQDLYAGDQLLLPKGTTLRGRVETVQKPGFFSRGGLMRLTFDNVQGPNGELDLLSLAIDNKTSKMNLQKNALYTDPGVGKKLDASVGKGVNQFKNFQARNKQPDPDISRVVSVPANDIAGVATGTAITTVNAGKAVFGKGESININPGDVFTLSFEKPAVLPTQ